MILALLWLLVRHKPQHLVLTSELHDTSGYMRVGYPPLYIHYDLLDIMNPNSGSYCTGVAKGGPGWAFAQPSPTCAQPSPTHAQPSETASL